VDDEVGICACLKDIIDLQGFVVYCAQDGEEAMKIFREKNPLMVITDIHMANGDGLKLTQDIKRLREDCPVVVMTGYGDEQTAISALKAGACDYLHKPFELTEIKETINRAMSQVRIKGMEIQSLWNMETLKVEFRLQNNLAALSGIIPFLLRPICLRLAKVEGLHVQMALQELLANAIEHGNLGISGKEKQEAIMADEYDALLERRQQDPTLMNRLVHVSLENDGQQGIFRCAISDEGDGFDWTVYQNGSGELPCAMVGSGRGIFLAKSLVPEIEYHGRGNEVTLVFRYQPVALSLS